MSVWMAPLLGKHMPTDEKFLKKLAALLRLRYKWTAKDTDLERMAEVVGCIEELQLREKDAIQRKS